MKFLIDMNLSPSWVKAFTEQGWEAVHWSMIGDPRASDRDILAWAAESGHIVVTHDLDFGTLLVMTGSHAPSVVQLRVSDLLSGVQAVLFTAVRRFERELTAGAILTVDVDGGRARMIPFTGAELGE